MVGPERRGGWGRTLGWESSGGLASLLAHLDACGCLSFRPHQVTIVSADERSSGPQIQGCPLSRLFPTLFSPSPRPLPPPAQGNQPRAHPQAPAVSAMAPTAIKELSGPTRLQPQMCSAALRRSNWPQLPPSLLLLAAAGWLGGQSPQGKERETRLEEDLA